MGVDRFKIKRNDIQPYYYAAVKSSTGTSIDLSGATIRVNMYHSATGDLKINRATAGLTITASVAGEFQYQWQAADTNTTGSYFIEFEITPASGGKFTVPSDRSARVEITGDFDAT